MNVGLFEILKFNFIKIVSAKKVKSQARKQEDNENDNSILNDLKQHYEISKTDEDSLLKLMSECDFASSSAEKFIERLQDELLKLDTVIYDFIFKLKIKFENLSKKIGKFIKNCFN